MGRWDVSSTHMEVSGETGRGLNKEVLRQAIFAESSLYLWEEQLVGIGEREGSVLVKNPTAAPIYWFWRSLKELPNGKKNPVGKLDLPRTWPHFFPYMNFQHLLKEEWFQRIKTKTTHGFWASSSNSRTVYIHACTKRRTYRGIQWCTVCENKRLEAFHMAPGILKCSYSNLSGRQKKNIQRKLGHHLFSDVGWYPTYIIGWEKQGAG